MAGKATFTTVVSRNATPEPSTVARSTQRPVVLEKDSPPVPVVVSLTATPVGRRISAPLTLLVPRPSDPRPPVLRALHAARAEETGSRPDGGDRATGGVFVGCARLAGGPLGPGGRWERP